MPVGQPPDDDQDPPAEDAGVVDPKVLAERRARRAEMAEESLLSRMNRAEQDRVLLATRLAETEYALDAARRERDALQDDLDRRERALRAAEQREFSEQQRRIEAEDEAVQARREMRADVDALRRQIAAAEEHTDDLAAELEHARREAAEAARSAAQERARATRQVTGGGERRALLAEGEAELSRRAADLQRQEREAAASVQRLEERRRELEADIGALQDGAAAEITLLQHELDRRTVERDEARVEQARLGAELRDVQAQLATAQAALADRDRQLADARRTVADLEGRRREFDARIVDLEASMAGLRSQTRASIDALEVRVMAEQAAKQAAVAELEAQRAELLQQRVTLEERALAERRELDELRRRADDELLRAHAATEDARSQRAGELDALREEAREARREAAEAVEARDVLEAELQRRVELEQQVRAAVVDLRSRLDAADAQETARQEREAEVESLVADLVDTATELRAGFERELDEERARFATELAAMEERVGVLRVQLTTAAQELRDELEAEQAARWAAEAELAAVQQELADLRAAAAAAPEAGLFAAKVAPDEVPVPAPALPEATDVDAEPEVQSAPERPVAADPETSALIADLQRAADRLRAQVAALEPEAPEPAPVEAEVEAEPEVEAPVEPDAEVEAEPAAPVEPEAPEHVEPSWAVQQAAAAMGLDLAGPQEPQPDAQPEPEADEAVGGAVTVLAPRTVDHDALAPWLARVLPDVVAADPDRGAALVQSLLHAQAARSGRDLVHDLVIDDLGAWRVAVRGGSATVDALEGTTGGDVDFAVVGPLAGVAPLVAGGAGRKLPDARVSGRRRRARRLLKDMRRPLGLPDLAALGDRTPDPGLLLELLVAAVDQAVVPGHSFTVDYDVEGAGVWHVRADERLVAGPGPGEGATAVVRVSDRSFAALLAGSPLAPGERAVVEGTDRPVLLLHQWFDTAQGIAR